MGENIGYAIAIIMSFVVTIISFVIMLINETRFHRKDTHRFDSLDKNTDRLSDEHNRLQDKIEDRIKETGSSLHSSIAVIEQQTGKVKDDLIRFIAKEEGVKEKVAELLPKEDRVLYEVQALYKKLSELSEDNDALRKSLERSEYMRRNMEKEIAKYQEEVAGLRKQVQNLTHETRTFKDPGYDEPDL